MNYSFSLTKLPILSSGIALLLAGFTLVTNTQAQKPVLEVRFNKDNDANLQNGATLAAGVSSKADDKSYSTDVLGIPDGSKMPRALLEGNSPATNLEEFTFTAWYRVRNTPRPDATLFDALGIVWIWDDKTNAWVMRVDTKPVGDSKAANYWFYLPRAPLGAWSVPEQWIFVAAAWKRSDKSVTFYQGNADTAAKAAGSVPRPEDVAPLNEREKANRLIGNNQGKSDRPFDGNIDDVRFYDKALTIESIEKIRQADLQNGTPAL